MKKCKRGHYWTEENTYIRTDGYKECRKCIKIVSKIYREKNTDKLNEKSRLWYRNNKQKVLKRMKKTNKIWQSKNREKCRKNSHAYAKRHPWVRTYRSINSRCLMDPFYKKKGIKAKIKVTEIREIWFRDKAYLMKRPTIDRIDRNGNYAFDNCQFLEFKDNLARRVFKKKKKKNKKKELK